MAFSVCSTPLASIDLQRPCIAFSSSCPMISPSELDCQSPCGDFPQQSPTLCKDCPTLHCSRRFWSFAALAAATAAFVPPAHARDRRNKKDIPIEVYQTSNDGLKFYDFVEGKGLMAENGQRVLVHFDCIFRGIDAVSSRESKILAGNRIIAQPYEFVIGSKPGKERKREFVENANGLFSAQASPKPPPALYTVTEGMRVGGRRTVIVPPELGYADKGLNEIPPGATFQMDVELLEVKSAPSS